jgi:hypothetical protein
MCFRFILTFTGFFNQAEEIILKERRKFWAKTKLSVCMCTWNYIFVRKVQGNKAVTAFAVGKNSWLYDMGFQMVV